MKTIWTWFKSLFKSVLDEDLERYGSKAARSGKRNRMGIL